MDIQISQGSLSAIDGGGDGGSWSALEEEEDVCMRGAFWTGSPLSFGGVSARRLRLTERVASSDWPIVAIV